MGIEGGRDGSAQPDGTDQRRDPPNEPDRPDWEGRYRDARYEKYYVSRSKDPKDDRGGLPLVWEQSSVNRVGEVSMEGVHLARNEAAFAVRHFDGGPDQRGLVELRLRLRLESQPGVTPAAADAVRQQALRGVETTLNAPGHTVGDDRLRFAVDFVHDAKAADATVRLHPGDGWDTSHEWYVEPRAVDRANGPLLEKVRTHEILHHFGLFDDYPDVTRLIGRDICYSLARVGPDYEARLQPDSIMGKLDSSSQGLTARHLAFFARAVEVAKDSRRDDPWPPTGVRDFRA